VIGDVATALDLHHVDAVGPPHMGIVRGAAERDHRRVLEQ
jgi:hypothetical protein